MLALLLLAACESTTVSGTTGCSLGLPTMSPTTAAPGDTVTLTATPLTEAWDTAVTVGASRATVATLDRSECDACDTCKDENDCVICGVCDACADSCATCVETVSFVVPDVPAGAHAVQLVNRYGRSETVQLVVTAADTGAVDTGPADTGPSDTAPADTSDSSAPADTAAK